MRNHVLFNLLNKLGKRDQMRGLLSILSLFRNKFIKLGSSAFDLNWEAFAFYLFFATSLINSVIQEHECWILFNAIH